MFLKKWIRFAGAKKRVKILENCDVTILNVVKKDGKVTEFVYKSRDCFNRARIMKDFSDEGILKVVKISDSSNTITTMQVMPFITVLDTSNTEFNKHVLYLMYKAIKLINTEYRIIHGGIGSLPFFITHDLRIVLGEFGRCEKGTSNSDTSSLVNFARKIGLQIPSNGVPPKEWFSAFYCSLGEKMEGLRFSKATDKLNIVNELRLQVSKGINSYVKERVVDWLVDDLEHYERSGETSASGKYYKRGAIDLIVGTNLKDTEVHSRLYTILDPDVREYLLKCETDVSLNNAAMDSILLGVRCRDERLQDLTVGFILKRYTSLSDKYKVKFLEFAKFLKNSDLVSRLCEFLVSRKGKETEDVNAVVLSFARRFVSVEGTRAPSLRVVEGYYAFFDCATICDIMAHILIPLLSYGDVQDDAFRVMRSALDHLEDEKKELVKGRWDLSFIMRGVGKKERKSRENVSERDSPASTGGSIADNAVENRLKRLDLKKKVEGVPNEDPWDDNW